MRATLHQVKKFKFLKFKQIKLAVLCIKKYL